MDLIDLLSKNGIKTHSSRTMNAVSIRERVLMACDGNGTNQHNGGGGEVNFQVLFNRPPNFSATRGR